LFAFEFIDQGNTLGGLSEELYRRGVPSPSGKNRWSRNALLKMLGNRKYVGDWVWGVQACGKRHRQKGGQVCEKQRDEPMYVRNDPDQWVVIPESHEPLVPRDL